MPFCTVGGPQDPQHYHGAGDATHGTRRDELVETLRQGGPFLGIYSSFLNLRSAVWYLVDSFHVSRFQRDRNSDSSDML